MVIEYNSNTSRRMLAHSSVRVFVFCYPAKQQMRVVGFAGFFYFGTWKPFGNCVWIGIRGHCGALLLSERGNKDTTLWRFNDGKRRVCKLLFDGIFHPRYPVGFTRRISGHIFKSSCWFIFPLHLRKIILRLTFVSMNDNDNGK